MGVLFLKGTKNLEILFIFVNFRRDENVNEDGCFWISRDYYEDACNFYRRESDYDSMLSEAEEKKEKRKRSKKEEKGRATPVIDANEFHTGKNNKIKYHSNSDDLSN